MFIDRIRVRLRGGDGGAGVAAFVRTRGKPKGRPNGGNGGDGGSVILRADPSGATLLRYQRNTHHRASSGTHGEGDVRHGRKGEDLVPLVGMGRPENVERNLEALRVPLDEADMAALDAAFPIGCAAGLRYPESMTSSLGREAPPAG